MRCINKYHNVKVNFEGMKFDSKKELNRFLELRILLNAGVIKDLKRQEKFIIVPKVGKNKRERFYIADFTYIDESGRKVIEDVKSKITKKNPVYSLKKSLILAYYPDYIFKEV